MARDPLSLKEILTRVLPTYVRVLPAGIELPSGEVVARLEAKILAWGFARTLYERRQPTCRSLDGIRPLKRNRVCASCAQRSACTPQIRLDLLHASGVYRLLLAYTSMRNFLLFLNHIPTTVGNGEGMEIVLDVVDRGKWGEVRFRPPPP